MTNKLSLKSIIFFGLNGIIGAGIFITPGTAYSHLGVYSLVALIVAAIIAMIMALCFAEMAGKFSETGGPYVYIKGTFGIFWGYQIGFIRLMVTCISWATVLLAIPTTLSSFYPWFGSFWGQSITASFLVIMVSLVNYAGVKSSEKTNNILVLIKFLPLLLFIVQGIFFIKWANFVQPSEAFVPTVNFQHFSEGFLIIIYSFYGFENLGVAAQDMDNPKKNLPIAIITIMIIVTIIYFLIFSNTIGILGPKILETDAPVASAMGTYLGGNAILAVVIASIISILGYTIAATFSNTRVLIPLAKDHFVPENLANLSNKGAPTQSITLLTAITLVIVILSCFLGSIFHIEAFAFLIIVSGIGRFLQFIPVMLAVLKSRKLGIPGTFRLFWAPVLVPVTVIISIFILLGIQWFFLVLGVILLITLSLLSYFLYAAPRRKRILKMLATQKESN